MRTSSWSSSFSAPSIPTTASSSTSSSSLSNSSSSSSSSNSSLSIQNLDLRGYWVANKGNNNLEILEIFEKQDGIMVARKVTGDSQHVPAGEISFEVNLRQGGVGKIQIAEKGFQNPEWAPGHISSFSDHDHFVFEWSNVRRNFTRIKMEPVPPSQYIFDGDAITYKPRPR
eukprot:TRINITY_DN2490_c0_g1_i1.p1 TRINITY_DN2490_c0_g1~~TRINITY_DN2490_c0_g1_i1.p1  ORF type:complete len:181 (-),score=58.84 TRINITY_DN2490_c0_g1_i1:35-547(-)